MVSRPSKLRGVIDVIAGCPSRVAIATDYDGTLAPIVEDPTEAIPDPGALDALGALSRSAGLVAIISGRPPEFLHRMVGLDTVVYVGLYGLERGSPGVEKWQTAIADAKKSAACLLGRRPESFRIEDKGLALVVHYRRAPNPVEASAIAGDWASDVAARAGLRVLKGKMNVELVPPIPLGKGMALQELLAEGAGEFEAAAFVGDDIGDLEAFEALANWESGADRRIGLRVAVASEECDPTIEHAADVVLPSQRDVAGFLATLARAAP